MKIFLYFLSAAGFKLSLELISFYIYSRIQDAFTPTIELNLSKIFESYLMLLAFIMLMPKKRNEFSSIVIWLFLILTYIPLLVIYGLSNESAEWMMISSLFWIIVLALLKLFDKPLSFSKYFLRESGIVRRVTIVFLSLYTLLLIFSNRNFELTVNFVYIYELRSRFSPILPFYGYVINWVGLVINPFLIGYCIKLSRYGFALFSCFLQMFIFTASGIKTILFAIPFILCLSYLIKRERLSFHTLTLGFSSLVCFSGYSYFHFSDLWFQAIVINRLLLLPASISFHYYDFFSSNPPVLLGHSIFRYFINYPYDLLPWYVIGRNYFTGEQLSANTGMIADSYMNFRIIGVILVAFIFALLLIIANSLCKKRSFILVTSLCIMPFLYLTNAGILTCILTGGLLLSLYLCFLLPTESLKLTESAKLK